MPRVWVSRSTSLGASLLTGLVLLGVVAGCRPRNPPVRPQRMDITQAVYASGRVYPAQYYRISAAVPGYLDTVFVQVGDSVGVGQPLFRVRNEAVRYSLDQSRSALTLAERNASANSPLLAAARDQVRLARTRLSLDSATFVRYAQLAQEGAGTRHAYDQARAQYESSRAALSQAQSNLEATRLRLSTELENARAAQGATRATAGNYLVRSTIIGRVYDQIPRTGEYVGPQTIVCELGELDRFEVELAIDEADINLISQGQRVVFGSEAMGQATAEGRIRQVFPKISSTSKSIRAMADITLPPGQTLFAGSTLEANIIYAHADSALVLPRAFLTEGDSVTLRVRGRMQRRAVRTGVRDGQYVQILAGLDEHTDVYRPR